MDEKDLATKDKNLVLAARLIKNHCDKHCFYNSGDCTGCVFAQKGECCPFGDPVPADWEV